MAATLTAGTFQSAPVTRNVHVGAFPTHFKYELNGASLSAGDVVLMGYIPQGVTVIDCYVWGSWSSAAATIDIGSQQSISALGTAVTCTAAGVNRSAIFVPRKFSLSSDAEGNLRVPIAIKVIAGTSTVTGSINLLLICANALPAIA